ncbi:hypothetical protein B0J13DRAFT_619253 [Dactylonectria estremocensis]|uniref:U6 snRNA phosphodiesterase n=1 Tax=Dactylonectria estremocensis TaxID=1079267 RepID=A0A9P9JCS8_9HYPO|nr:hypothetical protein B0J13DRAFT_619253 [Dactylonectria estremocensis]
MALVDYSSSEEEGDRQPPPAKRRKAGVEAVAHSSGTTFGAEANSSRADAGVSDMPPLPSEFHDLYASTVRQSVIDDPTLHHGRRRQIPHVVGHPTTTQHAVLVDLINDIERELGSQVELHNFLTSDLGSPLPLHISLSRPLSLPTADKDTFLEKVTHAVHTSAIATFAVRPNGLVWFKSPDSNRTFLVLRVDSNPSATEQDNTTTDPNPELMGLLTRFNAAVTNFGQPALYQLKQKNHVGNSFHISIAWTFDQPDDEASRRTVQLFEKAKFGIQAWEINVPGIKAKIGNVVNHIALSGSGRGGTGSRLLES